MRSQDARCAGKNGARTAAHDLPFTTGAVYRRVRFRIAAWQIRLRRVPARHGAAEVGELVDVARRAGVVRPDAARLGSEAERDSDLKILERGDQPVEPARRIGAAPISPTESRTDLRHAEPLEPLDGA